MLSLKVANKVVIKSTWKEQPCQEERQRHKSISLFSGLCPLTVDGSHGASWHPFPLPSVPGRMFSWL